jgi:hypothetical protein
MFIDFTTPAIQIDPERFPTGLVVQVLAVPEPGDRRGLPGIHAECRVSGDFGRASPKLTEVWQVRTTRCQRLTYSLTEQRDYVALEDENYVDFSVQSYFTSDENTFMHRAFTVTTVERGEGWTVEIEAHDPQQYGPDPSPVLFAIRMPQFNPRAVINLGVAPTKPQEIPEEKPPGKPIWERLDEEG